MYRYIPCFKYEIKIIIIDEPRHRGHEPAAFRNSSQSSTVILKPY